MPRPSSAQRAADQGLTDLHLAVLRNNFSRVKKILAQDDADTVINARTCRGATPLMLAVLFGRSKIALLLLRKKASVNARDGYGMTVADYSRGNEFTRAQAEFCKNARSPVLLSERGLKARRKLQRILRNREALRARYVHSGIPRGNHHGLLTLSFSQRRGDHKLSQIYMYRTSNRLVLLKPFAVLDAGKIKDTTTTAGFIASTAGGGVQKVAVSGWGGKRGEDSMVLSNVEYTQRVQYVSEAILDFKLPANSRDNAGRTALPEHKGRHKACHVVRVPCLPFFASISCFPDANSRAGETVGGMVG